MRTLVELVQSAHTDHWAERHDQGDVPDVWPYGLQRLANHGIDPVWEPRREGLTEYLGRLVSKITGTRMLEGWTVPVTGIQARLCWDERTGIPAALDPRTRGEIPVISGVIWATDPAAPRRLKWLLNQAFGNRDIVFTTSRGQVAGLRSQLSARVEYVPFGIDSDFWAQPKGFAPNTRLVVSAGNDRHRDFDVLIRGALNDSRNRLEVATRVSLPNVDRLSAGPKTHPQLRELFYRANVVAVATKPNDHCSGLTTTLEAMACGCPVVATNTPGLEDYIDDGVTGVLVPPGDAEALAASVCELLDDPEKAIAMGSAAATKVRQRFTTEHLACALAELIRDAVT